MAHAFSAYLRSKWLRNSAVHVPICVMFALAEIWLPTEDLVCHNDTQLGQTGAITQGHGDKIEKG